MTDNNEEDGAAPSTTFYHHHHHHHSIQDPNLNILLNDDKKLKHMVDGGLMEKNGEVITEDEYKRRMRLINQKREKATRSAASSGKKERGKARSKFARRRDEDDKYIISLTGKRREKKTPSHSHEHDEDEFEEFEAEPDQLSTREVVANDEGANGHATQRSTLSTRPNSSETQRPVFKVGEGASRRLYTPPPVNIRAGNVHTMAEITMQFVGLPNNAGPNTVKIEQQLCGYNSFTAFQDTLKPGATFKFISRRHRNYPFALSLHIDGLSDCRVSTCCEFSHAKNQRLGGPTGHFIFSSVNNASPCYKCEIKVVPEEPEAPEPPVIKQPTRVRIIREPVYITKEVPVEKPPVKTANKATQVQTCRCFVEVADKEILTDTPDYEEKEVQVVIIPEVKIEEPPILVIEAPPVMMEEPQVEVKIELEEEESEEEEEVPTPTLTPIPSPEPEPVVPPPGYKDAIIEVAKTTHIYSSKDWCSKIFWGLLAILVIIFLIILLINITRPYIFDVITTTIERKHSNKPEFPAITICNVNMVRCSKAQGCGGSSTEPDKGAMKGVTTPKSSSSASVTTTIDQSTTSSNTSTTTATTNTSTNTSTSTVTTTATSSVTTATINATTVISRKKRDVLNDLKRPADEAGPEKSLAERVKLSASMSDVSEEERKKLGHQLPDMVISCAINGEECKPEHWGGYHWNSKYGNCYTFNSGDLAAASTKREDEGGTLWSNLQNTSATLKSIKPGPNHGLELTLNIEPREYQPFLDAEAGIRVVIHNQTRMPFPDEDAFMVSPGQTTYVGMRLKHFYELEDQFDEVMKWRRYAGDVGCISESSGGSSIDNMYSNYGFDYSRLACLKTCYQNNVITTCRCYDTFLPNVDEEGEGGRNKTNSRGSSVPPCEYGATGLNQTQWSCMVEINQKFTDGELLCNCPSSCFDSVFTTGISTSAWPSMHNVSCQGLVNKILARLTLYGTNGTNGDVMEYEISNLAEAENITYWNITAPGWFRSHHQVVGDLIDGVNWTDPNSTMSLEESLRAALCEDPRYGIAPRVAALKIYYEDFNFEEVRQHPKVTFLDIIPDSGASFSFLLGVSIYSLFEYVKLFGKLAMLTGQKTYRKIASNRAQYQP